MSTADSIKKTLEKLIDEFNVKSSIQDGSTKYLQNYEALEYFKTKQSQLNNISTIAAALAAVGLGTMPFLTLAGATGAYAANELSIPVDRLVSVMEILLEEFKNEEIIITPRIKTEEGIIDLFVKTPDRRSFGLMLRSNGDTKVKWREDRQDFIVKRNNKSISKWSELDPVAYKLNSMMKTLRDKESPLLGNSRTERKKALTKAIVLTGKTIIDPNNDPALLVDFGRTTALRVNSTSTYYLVNRENIADFLRKPLKE
jgi:hypothetical protein